MSSAAPVNSPAPNGAPGSRGQVANLARFLPALGWAGLIFFLSAQSQLPGQTFLELPGADKVAHAVVYAALAGWLAWADRGGRLALWFAAAAAYGVTDEWHQAFVPGRMTSVFDWLADAAGAGGAMLVWAYRARRRR